MTQLELLGCAVCGQAFAGYWRKRLNGLPADVPVCVRCRQAVQDRHLGITKREDGQLSIYGVDGCGQRHQGVSA